MPVSVDVRRTLGKATGYRLALDQLRLPTVLARGGAVLVQTLWVNEGAAPTYEPWQVVVQLRRPGDGTVVWETASTLDLRAVLPAAPVAHTDVGTLPATIAPGPYDISLLVRDPRGTRAPLQLATAGRQNDGRYRLGSITVR